MHMHTMAAYVLDGQLSQPVIGTTPASLARLDLLLPGDCCLGPWWHEVCVQTHTGEASRLHRGWHILGGRGHKELPQSSIAM